MSVYGKLLAMSNQFLLCRCNGVVVCGDKRSPVIHLRLAKPSKDDERILTQVANYCLDQGVAVVTAKYLPDELSVPPSR